MMMTNWLPIKVCHLNFYIPRVFIKFTFAKARIRGFVYRREHESIGRPILSSYVSVSRSLTQGLRFMIPEHGRTYLCDPLFKIGQPNSATLSEGSLWHGDVF